MLRFLLNKCKIYATTVVHLIIHWKIARKRKTVALLNSLSALSARRTDTSAEIVHKTPMGSTSREVAVSSVETFITHSKIVPRIQLIRSKQLERHLKEPQQLQVQNRNRLKDIINISENQRKILKLSIKIINLIQFKIDLVEKDIFMHFYILFCL